MGDEAKEQKSTIAAAARQPGEFRLTLTDGRTYRFMINAQGAARFEKCGKPFSEFNASSVSDLAAFLDAMRWRNETDLDFSAMLEFSRRGGGVFRMGRGSNFIDVLPLAQKAILHVQYVIMAALAEVRGTNLPPQLLELVRTELGALPSLGGEASPSAPAGGAGTEKEAEAAPSVN